MRLSFKNMPIKRKLLISFIAFSLIPVIILESLISLVTSTALKKDILNTIQVISEGKEAEILQYLSLLNGRTVDFGNDGFIMNSIDRLSNIQTDKEKQKTKDTLSNYLIEFKKPLDKNIKVIELFNSNNKLIATTNDKFNSSNDIDIIKDQTTNSVNFHTNDTNDEQYISTRSKIYSLKNKDKVIGKVIIHYSIAAIKNILKGISAKDLGALTVSNDLDNGIEMFLVNKNGDIISSLVKQDDLQHKRKKLNTLPVKLCQHNEEITGQWLNKHGKNVWGSSMCLQIAKDNFWILIVQKDKQAAMQPITKTRKIFYIIGIFVIILIGIFSSLMAKTISKPIKKLHEGVKRLSEADFDCTLNTNTKDEIGELSREFDYMATSLSEVIDKYKSMVDKYKGLMNILPTGVNIASCDTNLNIKELNKAILYIFGYESKDEFLSVPFEKVFTAPDESKKFFELCKNKSIYQYEIRFRRKDGSIFWASVNSTFYTTNEGKQELINVIDDITEKKKYEETLEQMAYYDHLTGLANRKMLITALGKTIAIAKRHVYTACVLFMDLDGFKKINDTFGHDVGDTLLKEAATRIKRAIRKSDIATRIGGDEFVVILSTITDKTNAASIATKIIKTLNTPFYINGHECKVGTSIGSSFYPDDSLDPDDLIKKADMAMYHVKQRGKNNYAVWSNELTQIQK